MKYLFFIPLYLVLSFSSSASDTTRVLFIGNSFTYFNNMPQMVKTIADSANLTIKVGVHAPGGVSVGDTAQGSMAHMNNPVLFALIRSQKWDFAVIQDNQGRFVLDSAVFPSKSKVVQGHLNIMDSLKANNPCAKIILFGGWGWKYGSPPYGNTGIETIRRILKNYCVLNDTMKEVIAPIGEAWIKAVNDLPSVNLWDTDDTHPSNAGSYLTASVIFSTIFDIPSKALNYYNTLSTLNAFNLRAISDSVVFGLNFHSHYNLGGIKKISLQQSNGQLSVPGVYTNYAWYKNKIYLGNTSTLLFSGNGDYTALVQENDGCLVKTCGIEALSAEAIEEKSLSNIRIFPNPVSGGIIHIKSEERINKIELINLSGIKEPLQMERSNGEVFLSLKNLKSGAYFLILESKEGTIHKKILIMD